jgi:hypothetical protein
MTDQLFLDICDRLNAQVPVLEWIDMDWGQLELPEQSYPIQFDCCLISFPDIPWDSLTRGYQEGLVQVQVRVAVDMFNDTHIAGGVAAPDRATAAAKMQLTKAVNKALHGFDGTYFSKLTRKRTTEEKRTDGLKVWVLTYETRAQENSAAAVYDSVIASASVTGSMASEV